MSEPLLEMRGIVKQFPGVRALDGVDLEVRAGEVHCLLGQNGAGKSTLIKVLAGAHQPDEGDVLVAAASRSRCARRSRRIRQGIATIYQELDLVDGLSVAENIFLGHETEHRRLLAAATPDAPRRALLTRLGHPRDLAAPRSGLAVGGRQADRQHGPGAVPRRQPDRDGRAVGRARRRGGRATSSASSATSPRDGVAVVYISHRLEEIRQIGDRITVLKDGRTVATGLRPRTTPTARADPADDRARRSSTSSRRGEPSRRRRRCRCSRSTDLSRAGEFERRVLRGPAGRDRRARRARRRRAAPRSSRRSTAPARPRTGTVQVRGEAASRRGSVRAAVAAGHRPGARGAQVPGPAAGPVGLPATSRSRRMARSRARRIRPSGAEHAAATRAGRRRWTSGRPTRPSGAHAVRRQPAEGRAGRWLLQRAAACCCWTSRRAASTSAPAARSTC